MGGNMTYVLDTCALLWWTLDPEKLSPSASEHCKNIDLTGACIASVTIWEIGVKIQKGKLNIGIPIKTFSALLEQVKVEQVPIDTELWLESLELDWDHRDPADRLIVALAKQRNLPIITSDNVIRKYYPSVIW
jgi:PIN domain nuclease of toxin-antitoxin system